MKMMKWYSLSTIALQLPFPRFAVNKILYNIINMRQRYLLHALCARIKRSKSINELIGGPLQWGPGARAPMAHALIRY